MFKLLITLINCQNGDVRQFVHAEEYPTCDDALCAARRMEYTRADKQGKLTHKCTVNIMEMEG
ncbi:hypothetical protein G5G56_000781 [Escherichia coli]|nr:hypothetical protein [Escherichia coli]EGB0947389.1 hypothetical protein [Escherichia coli]